MAWSFRSAPATRNFFRHRLDQRLPPGCTPEQNWARVGLTEPDVIRLMRRALKASSYRVWRMRMRGRVTKHRALRNLEMKHGDRSIADHRRANC